MPSTASTRGSARRKQRIDHRTEIADPVLEPMFEAEFDAAFEQAQTRFGALHGLVNSAGIIRPAMIEKMEPSQWQQVIDVNLSGSYYCVQAFGRRALQLIKAGNVSPRSIVNISSDAGRMGTIGQINYSAAKAGLFGITLSAAREWAKHDVRSNAICFGLVETAQVPSPRWHE